MNDILFAAMQMARNLFPDREVNGGRALRRTRNVHTSPSLEDTSPTTKAVKEN